MKHKDTKQPSDLPVLANGVVIDRSSDARPETQGRCIEILIAPDGRVFILFDESLADVAAAICAAFGSSTMKRAGSVEATKDGRWYADLRRCGGPVLSSCTTHREAVAMKEAWLSAHLVEIAENKKFWRGRGRPKQPPPLEEDRRHARRAQRAKDQRHWRNLRPYQKQYAAWVQRGIAGQRLRKLADALIQSETPHRPAPMKTRALDEFRRWVEADLTYNNREQPGSLAPKKRN
jgi:hypothetical protein